MIADLSSFLIWDRIIPWTIWLLFQLSLLFACIFTWSRARSRSHRNLMVQGAVLSAIATAIVLVFFLIDLNRLHATTRVLDVYAQVEPVLEWCGAIVFIALGIWVIKLSIYSYANRARKCR